MWWGPHLGSLSAPAPRAQTADHMQIVESRSTMRPFEQADPRTQQHLVDRRMGVAPRHEQQPRAAKTRTRRRALRVAVATSLAAVAAWR